jgi:16S rRNA (guanine(966)-N(2))-methyltransferase RsmD
MRVISGLYKGKKLKSPLTEEIRPTLDRVKEAIFDVIQFRLTGAKALDLFSGSGAMGIEAVSRGCSEVIFNDISDISCSLIRENCLNTGFTPIIYTLDYKRLLSRFASENKKFDIIFVDPPYEGQTGIDAVNLIIGNKVINSGGVIVYEHSADMPQEYLSDLKGNIIKRKKYGTVIVDFIYC